MVFYIEIGNLKEESISAYMKKSKKNINKGFSKKERKQYIRMFIPTRGKTSKIEII